VTPRLALSDGKLVLAEPLPENSRVLVTIEDAALPASERAAWLSLSEQSLLKAWDNPDDDVFNELLSK
jgi:hypothetical protein